MTRGSSLGAPTRGESNARAKQVHQFRTHQSRLFGRRGIRRVFTHYFTHAGTLKPLVSALLAIVLWPLLLLGITLHIK